MAADTKAIVRVVFDRFNAREVDRVAAICADEFLLEDLPAGLTLHGPAGCGSGCRRGLRRHLTPTPR